ncbi:hypothetical protein GEMRC1_006313 [Eukaryota sp. GEM-RC1]
MEPIPEIVLSGCSTQTGLSFWHPVTASSIASCKQIQCDARSLCVSSKFFAAIQTGSPVIFLCSYAKNTPVFRCTLDIQPLCLAISSDCLLLIAGCEDGSVRIWDIQSGALLSSHTLHFAPIRSLSVSPCNDYLSSGGDDCAVHVWDLFSLLSPYSSSNTNQTLPTPRFSFSSFTSSVCSVHFSSAIVPPRLYATSFDGSLLITCPVSGSVIFNTTLSSGISSMAVDLLDTVLACGHQNGTITILHLQNLLHSPLKPTSISAHSSDVVALSFAQHSQRLFSGSSDGFIKSFDLTSMQSVTSTDLKAPVGTLICLPTPPLITFKERFLYHCTFKEN